MLENEQKKKFDVFDLKDDNGNRDLTFSHIVHPFTDLDSIGYFDPIAQRNVYANKYDVCLSTLIYVPCLFGFFFLLQVSGVLRVRSKTTVPLSTYAHVFKIPQTTYLESYRTVRVAKFRAEKVEFQNRKPRVVVNIFRPR